MNNKLEAVIEISKNSKLKYEYDRETGKMKLDRILYGSNSYPQNYGFIPETIDWDGDELDVLIIADQPFLNGAIVPFRVLGAMKMIDAGETDTKLIGVVDCDPRYAEYKDFDSIPKHLLKEIKDFFENYKNLQNKKVEISGFEKLDYALKEIEECRMLFKKYSKLPKEEFISKMRKEHPEKYK